MNFRSFAFPMILLLFASCEKDPVNNNGNGTFKLGYPSQVYYVKSSAYVVAPTTQKSGTYKAYPSDLRINESNGQITVSVEGSDGKQSQTGLMYKIVFNGTDGTKDSTYLTIAGINYQDKIYYQSTNDSIVKPIYNADRSLPVPTGTYSSNNNKVAIDQANGQINLYKSIRNGLFNDDPQNDDWRIIRIRYNSDDASGGVQNEIEVIIYYYTSITNIPANVSAVMRAHQAFLFGIPAQDIPLTNAPIDDSIEGKVFLGKPRPPCIILLAD